MHKRSCRSWLLITLTTLASVCAGACSIVADFDERPTTDAGSDAQPVADCPDDMAPVPKLSGGGYCIDRTEVTVRAYSDFLKAGVTTAGQDPRCDDNKTFAPAENVDNKCTKELVDPSTRPDYPMACIDFCDALAYCKWKGKHLCGHVDSDGEVAVNNDFEDFDDPSKSEWHNVCTMGGELKYPYGNEFNSEACVDDENLAVEVGTSMLCVGGYPGIFDISGNVSEWENSCKSSGGVLSCRIRGGAFYYYKTLGETALLCNNEDQGSTNAMATFNTLGFRCCQ